MAMIKWCSLYTVIYISLCISKTSFVFDDVWIYIFSVFAFSNVIRFFKGDKLWLNGVSYDNDDESFSTILMLVVSFSVSLIVAPYHLLSGFL